MSKEQVVIHTKCNVGVVKYQLENIMDMYCTSAKCTESKCCCLQVLTLKTQIITEKLLTLFASEFMKGLYWIVIHLFFFIHFK